MSTISLDDHIASTLTPEELEAIKDVDAPSPGDRAALERIAASADDDGDDETEVGGDPDEVLDADGKPVATTTEVQAAAKTTEVPASTDTPDTPDLPDADPVFVFKSELPADFNDRVAALTAEETELRQKFKDGDIDMNEYDAQRDAIMLRRTELNNIKIRADIADDMNRQSAQAREQSFETKFIASKSADGLDYSAERNVKLFNSMLADVMEEHPNKSKEWHWNEAHKKALTVRGLAPAAPKPTPTPTPAKTSRAAPVDALPQTLAQVPGSDGPGDVGSEFAYIDSLVGDEQEDAIARLTPAQRAKFAAGR